MSSRDPWLDNAKMALVALVVVGHTWALLPSSALTDQGYDFLYSWHMPAFVMITGYLSRSFVYSWDRLWQLLTSVAVPYVVFETALSLFRIHVGGENLQDLYLQPHFPLWYLVAVVVWRLLAPLFKALPAAEFTAPVLALGLSLAGGFWFYEWFNFWRLIGFLPFFVLGLCVRPQWLGWLQRPSARIAGVVVLALGLLAARFVDSWASTSWFYAYSYSQLDVGGAEAVLTRLAVIAVGLVSALAFLAVVPRTPGWFAEMGSATLVVYLFHGFVIKELTYLGFDRWADRHPGEGAVAAVLIGLAVALLLACRPVRGVLGVVADPFAWSRAQQRDAVELTLTRSDAERWVAAEREREPVGAALA